MIKNRRKFIAGSGLLVGGLALSGLQLAASEDSIEKAERDVSSVLSQYGKSFEITNRGESAVKFKVKMAEPEKFASAFDCQKSLPFERIMVKERNTLEFTHAGVDFTIVNVA